MFTLFVGFKGNFEPGFDFHIDHLSWKKLPDDVFESFGGRLAAKEKRRNMGYTPKPATIPCNNKTSTETAEVNSHIARSHCK